MKLSQWKVALTPSGFERPSSLKKLDENKRIGFSHTYVRKKWFLTVKCKT
jgi:hypothetical protein